MDLHPRNGFFPLLFDLCVVPGRIGMRGFERILIFQVIFFNEVIKNSREMSKSLKKYHSNEARYNKKVNY